MDAARTRCPVAVVIVLSVDPGGTSYATRGNRPQGSTAGTGLVLFRPVSKLEIDVLCWKEIVERHETLDWIAQLKLWNKLDYVICESYYPAGFVKSWEPDVVYIIGTLEYMFGPQRFYNKTNAASASAHGTKDKLRPYIQGENAVGRGGQGHAIMALKHALHWTANNWKES